MRKVKEGISVLSILKLLINDSRPLHCQQLIVSCFEEGIYYYKYLNEVGKLCESTILGISNICLYCYHINMCFHITKLPLYLD